MIKSTFIADIMDLLLDGEEMVSLREQLPYLTESEYEYTGVGLFVSFEHDAKIQPTTIINDSTVINGVEITSSDLEIGADAKIFLTNGLINYVEIWSFSGNYPRNELSDYRIEQKWKGSPGRSASSPRNSSFKS